MYKKLPFLCVTGENLPKNIKMDDQTTTELEQGWKFMEKGIAKLKRILEGLNEPPFNSEEYMMLYT